MRLKNDRFIPFINPFISSGASFVFLLIYQTKPDNINFDLNIILIDYLIFIYYVKNL